MSQTAVGPRHGNDSVHMETARRSLVESGAPVVLRARPSRLRCELICHSNSKHLQYVYTGFALLARRGLIDLRQTLRKPPAVLPQRVQHLRTARSTHMRVIINGRLRLHYDTHDSEDIDAEYLEQADYYFKRSYSQAHVERSGYDARKIHPLGLYYEVYPDGVDLRRYQRILALDEGWASRLRKLVHAVPKIGEAEALPDFDAPPRILFNVKAWDPHDAADRVPEKVEERRQLNEMRARCLRLLKAEFGPAFFGGFVHGAYARRHFRDLLLPDERMASKSNYMKLVRSFPICVATTGLHGSIGAKFAEYICLSKAILSERLLYGVPGDLEEGCNYLQFTTAEECVAQARRLFDDADLRHRLMINNARYYNAWLRPDVLVMNTLLKACGDGGPHVSSEQHALKVGCYASRP